MQQALVQRRTLRRYRASAPHAPAKPAGTGAGRGNAQPPECMLRTEILHPVSNSEIIIIIIIIIIIRDFEDASWRPRGNL